MSQSEIISHYSTSTPMSIAQKYAAADADAEMAYLKALQAGRPKNQALSIRETAFKLSWRELMGY